MLNILRKNAQSFVIQIIVVLIAVVFIFWGVGTNLGGNRNAVAKVNGEEISLQEYQQNYERAVDNYKQQFGGQIPEGFLNGLGLKNQVLEQLIQVTLLRQGAGQIGLSVSKEATQRAIEKMKVFEENGRFDLKRYKDVLAQNRLTPTSFEEGIRNDLLVERVMEAIGAFSSLADKEVQNWQEFSSREIKLAYTSFKGSEYLGDVSIEESELATWYEGKKDQYKTAPRIKAQYLFFANEDDLGQVVVSDEEIAKRYEENKAKYSTPEQRHARHILFKVSKDDAKGKEMKKQAAERVLAKVRAGGDFARLADEHSEDSAKGKGGDLGAFSRGRMVKPFEDAAFAMKKGEVSELVETPFGYHIIKLEGIVPETHRTLAEVKDSISKELGRQAVKGLTFKKASAAYEDIIRAGNLQKFGEKSGVAIKSTEVFSQDNPPGGIVKDPAFLQAAFALRKGELSSLVETASGYAILYVDELFPSSVPEFKEVRDRVTADFRKEKSVELAQAKATESLDRLREKGTFPEGKSIQESGYVQRFSPPADLPAPLQESAFALNGRAVYPNQPVSFENAYYIFKIVDTRQGKDGNEATQRKNLEEQLLAAQRNKLVSDWLGQLRKEADIWTNRELLQ